ncbi:MAG TPA: DHH family phosphoesterase [Deltaproteobacteria bacterium]|nr:DHH family phosphoesterase [Deltaproteobacteria bacterium]HQI82158.1 DHH family phosphoesterase [Deltaproteobacteria bacterium]
MKTRIAEIIKTHTSFEIISHEGPDEDAVGSSRALGLALASLGKAVCLVYPTPVPEALDFTEAPPASPAFDPEVSIIVDLSDPAMLRGVRPRGEAVVIIDHHRARGGFGTAAWIDPGRSSTAELVHELIRELGAPVTAGIAANLYMGLFGDTGGFIHANTNARVFRLAHELVELGADPHDIAYRIKRTKAYAFYQVLCTVMNRMIMQGGVFASYISHDELAGLKARPEDASGIVEEMASLKDAALIIFLREERKGMVKASIRSRVADAALKTAAAFGGGGHGLAAGFTVEGSPQELIGKVVAEGVKWVPTA